MARVNSTKIVSRFFDSSAHTLPITFYNRKTPSTMPNPLGLETPYYPGMRILTNDQGNIVDETINWESITTDKYKFDSTLTKTRVKAVWSADISNWHYPKIFNPGFEYAVWGRSVPNPASDKPWLLYDKVADKAGTLSYTFPSTEPNQIVVMIHNPNYPPATNILTGNPKPDSWHFLVGSYSAV